MLLTDVGLVPLSPITASPRRPILFSADAGPEAPRFLQLLAALVRREAGVTPAMIMALTIRADRYEPLQIDPELAEVHRVSRFVE